MTYLDTLILESVRTDSIVHAEHSVALIEALLAACDDTADSAESSEYWGFDEGGSAWRIHVHTQIDE